MKIAVLGASGMAGHLISLYFIEQGHEVYTFSRKALSFGQNILLDVMDIHKVKVQLCNHEFDVVINCIGILNKDAENSKSKAVYINAYLPHFLAELLQNTKTKLIHLSTDCVFSGKEGGYTEDAFKDGESFYDRSKALGEFNNEKDLVFRNSIIGPDTKREGIGLFNWFMKQNGEIQGYNGVIWNGVTSLELAKAIDKAIEDNLTGLIHLVPNENISKYNLLCMFNDIFRNSEIVIRPNDKIKMNKTLVRTREDVRLRKPSYNEMLLDMREWIHSHSDLYHY